MLLPGSSENRDHKGRSEWKRSWKQDQGELHLRHQEASETPTCSRRFFPTSLLPDEASDHPAASDSQLEPWLV